MRMKRGSGRRFGLVGYVSVLICLIVRCGSAVLSLWMEGDSSGGFLTIAEQSQTQERGAPEANNTKSPIHFRDSSSCFVYSCGPVVIGGAVKWSQVVKR